MFHYIVKPSNTPFFFFYQKMELRELCHTLHVNHFHFHYLEDRTYNNQKCRFTETRVHLQIFDVRLPLVSFIFIFIFFALFLSHPESSVTSLNERKGIQESNGKTTNTQSSLNKGATLCMLRGKPLLHHYMTTFYFTQPDTVFKSRF